MSRKSTFAERNSYLYVDYLFVYYLKTYYLYALCTAL